MSESSLGSIPEEPGAQKASPLSLRRMRLYVCWLVSGRGCGMTGVSKGGAGVGVGERQCMAMAARRHWRERTACSVRREHSSGAGAKGGAGNAGGTPVQNSGAESAPDLFEDRSEPRRAGVRREIARQGWAQRRRVGADRSGAGELSERKHGAHRCLKQVRIRQLPGCRHGEPIPYDTVMRSESARCGSGRRVTAGMRRTFPAPTGTHGRSSA